MAARVRAQLTAAQGLDSRQQHERLPPGHRARPPVDRQREWQRGRARLDRVGLWRRRTCAVACSRLLTDVISSRSRRWNSRRRTPSPTTRRATLRTCRTSTSLPCCTTSARDTSGAKSTSVLRSLSRRTVLTARQTYSGLFLVAVNPYRSLPIYTPQIINRALRSPRPATDAVQSTRTSAGTRMTRTSMPSPKRPGRTCAPSRPRSLSWSRTSSCRSRCVLMSRQWRVGCGQDGEHKEGDPVPRCDRARPSRHVPLRLARAHRRRVALPLLSLWRCAGGEEWRRQGRRRAGEADSSREPHPRGVR